MLFFKTKTNQFINVDTSQRLLKLNPAILAILKSDQKSQAPKSLLDDLLRHILESKPLDDGLSLNPNEPFLLSIQIDTQCLNQLISSFSNCDFKFNLHLNTNSTFGHMISIQLEMNLFENFVQKGWPLFDP